MLRDLRNDTSPAAWHSVGHNANARFGNIIAQIFSRELDGTADGCLWGAACARAVILFNRGEKPLNITVTWKELGLSTEAGSDSYQVRDVCEHNRYGQDVSGDVVGDESNSSLTYTALVQPHAAATLTIKYKSPCGCVVCPCNTTAESSQ